MTEITGFRTKKEAKLFKKLHGGKVAYERDERGHSKNPDLYYIAVRFGHLDRHTYPFCVLQDTELLGA